MSRKYNQKAFEKSIKAWTSGEAFRNKTMLPDCETCKKCGTNNCGNDTTNLQCYEPKN